MASPNLDDPVRPDLISEWIKKEQVTVMGGVTDENQHDTSCNSNSNSNTSSISTNKRPQPSHINLSMTAIRKKPKQ